MAHQEMKALHPAIGAVVTGLDLKADTSPATGTMLRGLVDKYGLLLLRDQGLADPALIDFAALFGTISIAKSGDYGQSNAGLFRITNLDAHGGIMGADANSIAVNVANQLWHSDKTYTRPRATYAFLQACVVPPEGADTQYCDTRLAYDELPDTLREEVETLSAEHSIFHSRALTGFDSWSEEEKRNFAPTHRPIVQYHAESGRKYLCLASHMASVDGYAPARAAALIETLIAFAARPEKVYSHKWQPGDLLIWDNRITMHRVTPFEAERHARDMRSARVLDPAEAA